MVADVTIPISIYMCIYIYIYVQYILIHTEVDTCLLLLVKGHTLVLIVYCRSSLPLDNPNANAAIILNPTTKLFSILDTQHERSPPYPTTSGTKAGQSSVLHTEHMRQVIIFDVVVEICSQSFVRHQHHNHHHLCHHERFRYDQQHQTPFESAIVREFAHHQCPCSLQPHNRVHCSSDDCKPITFCRKMPVLEGNTRKTQIRRTSLTYSAHAPIQQACHKTRSL